MESSLTDRDNKVEAGQLEDYLPSWLDKVSRRVDRFPGPNWIYYLGFVVLLILLGGLLQWLENPLRPAEFPPISIIIFFQIAYILSLIDFLNKRSEIALEEFRPILKADDSQFQALKIRLTMLPSRPIVLITVLTALITLGLGLIFMNLPTDQASNSSLSHVADLFKRSASGYHALGGWILLWILNFIFIYRTFRQLRMIDAIYTHQTEINIFRQTELYAFSKVSASIAIGLVLTSPAWIIIDSGVITMGVNIVFAVLAIFIFISPLMGVHSLLKKQKDQLIEEVQAKKEALIRKLFFRLEKNDLEGIENLEHALSSVEKADNEIKKISTWPWQTNTLRQMIGALFLPITIWIIQYFLNLLLSN